MQQNQLSGAPFPSFGPELPVTATQEAKEKLTLICSAQKAREGLLLSTKSVPAAEKAVSCYIISHGSKKYTEIFSGTISLLFLINFRQVTVHKNGQCDNTGK